MAIVKRNYKSCSSYVVRVRDQQGQWFPSKNFSSKDEARVYEALLLSQKSVGKEAKSIHSREKIFSAYWEEWKISGRTKASEGWKKSQDQMYRDHFPDWFKQKKLREITPKQIANLLVTVANKGLGAQMQLHVFNLLHKMFNDAIELFEYLDTNPVKRKLKPSPPEVNRKFLRADIAWEFLESVRHDPFAIPIWIECLAGLRSAEIQTLQWGDIDEVQGVVTVSRQYARKEKIIRHLKNKKIKRIPLPHPLLEFLLCKRPVDYKSSDYVCSGPRDPGQMMNYNSYYKALKRLCAQGGFELLATHELRHTAAEIWKDSGANKSDISKLLGNTEAAASRYWHDTDDRLSRLRTSVAKRPQLALVKAEA